MLKYSLHGRHHFLLICRHSVFFFSLSDQVFDFLDCVMKAMVGFLDRLHFLDQVLVVGLERGQPFSGLAGGGILAPLNLGALFNRLENFVRQDIVIFGEFFEIVSQDFGVGYTQAGSVFSVISMAWLLAARQASQAGTNCCHTWASSGVSGMDS